MERLLVGVGLTLLCGCGPAGTVSFKYVLLDDNGAETPASCDLALGGLGVSKIRFFVGDDTNGNQRLDDDEVIDQVEEDCNQSDANADGVLGQDELGSFSGGKISAGEFGTFAVELVTGAGGLVAWQTFNDLPDTRPTFGVGVGFVVEEDADTFIPFAGNGQLEQELQIFLPTIP